ncbi:hypothetical protein CEXT_466091 [Caerostris extrusa]|uniref:Uncharacterized protein n=1 Tax=Caerostris extrusa TaxID=172846 RepID=A0AAV4XU10_CAEEX|nr:hypothetical protein CEXT_466091 [Caerostris extrusa]
MWVKRKRVCGSAAWDGSSAVKEKVLRRKQDEQSALDTPKSTRRRFIACRRHCDTRVLHGSTEVFVVIDTPIECHEEKHYYSISWRMHEYYKIDLMRSNNQKRYGYLVQSHYQTVIHRDLV